MDSVIYGFAKSPLELSEQWRNASIWSISQKYRLKGLFGDIQTDSTYIQHDLWNAVSIASAQKAVFVVPTISKLSTSSQKAIKAIDMLSLAGASLICIEEEINTSSSHGVPILKIVHAFNEMNRAAYEKRIMSIKKKQANGYLTGNIPYGWKIESSSRALIQDEKEMSIVKKIIDLRKAECTYRYISQHLMESGLLARRGTTWHPKVIMDIYKRYTKKQTVSTNVPKKVDRTKSTHIGSHLEKLHIIAFKLLVDELKTSDPNKPKQFFSDIQVYLRRHIIAQ